jgi:hypothetical protein
VNPLDCFVNYGNPHVFDLANKNHVLMEVVLDGELKVADSDCMPSLVVATWCTPVRILSRDDMMKLLLLAPPSRFMSVVIDEASNTVTLSAKKWEVEVSKLHEESADEDYEDYEDYESEDPKHGDGDGDRDRKRDAEPHEAFPEDVEWTRAMAVVALVRDRMAHDNIANYSTFLCTGPDWPLVSVGADPAAMIVEGQGVFRAVWVPGHVSGLKRVTNRCVEWQDAEGAYHRDGDLPARIQHSGSTSFTWYDHGVLTRRADPSRPTKENYIVFRDGTREMESSAFLKQEGGLVGRPEQEGPAFEIYGSSRVVVYCNPQGVLHRVGGPAIDTNDHDSEFHRMSLDSSYIRNDMPPSASVIGSRLSVAVAWIEDGKFTDKTSVLYKGSIRIEHARCTHSLWRPQRHTTHVLVVGAGCPLGPRPTRAGTNRPRRVLRSTARGHALQSRKAAQS